MPSVYDTQTNLSARGKYAPSVNYYATVREPNAVEPRLEKVKADPINIDFTSLANALTSVKEGEYKLQASALQMEQDMRNAAADRQLRIDLANMEDARARELSDRELQNRWDIAKMQDETNRLKIESEKKKSQRTENNRLAGIALLNDKDYQDKIREYTNGDMNDLEFQMETARFVSKYATEYDAEVNNLLTTIKGLGLNTGFGNTVKTNQEQEKKLNEQQQNADLATGGIINPNGSVEEKIISGAEYRNSLNSVQNANRILNNPQSTTMEKEMASRIMNKDLNSMIDTTIAVKMKAAAGSLPYTNDPINFIETVKEAVVNDVAESTGISRADIRNKVDAAAELSGLNRMLQGIKDLAGDNSAYKQNLLNTYTNSVKLDQYKETPELVFDTIFGDLLNFMPDDVKGPYKQTLATTLFGTVTPNYKWTENGQEYTGWLFTKQDQNLRFTSDEVTKYMVEKGYTTPQAAIYDMAHKTIKELPNAINDNRVNANKVLDYTKKNLSILTGNPNIDQSNTGLTAQQVLDLQNNVMTCINSNKCTPEDLDKIADAVPSNDKEAVRHLARIWSGTAKLANRFGVGSARLAIAQATAYLNPDQLRAKEILKLVGATGQDTNWFTDNMLNIKNTDMGYIIKDGEVYIDYTQRGLIKTGTDELNKHAAYVRNALNMAGLTLEEKISYYKQNFPGIKEQDEKVTPSSVFTGAVSIIQDLTIGKGAKIDTQLMSMFADAAKPSIKFVHLK